MISELLRRWFTLPECRTCEVLERELAECKREKEILLNKLLAPKVEERVPEIQETPIAISGGRRFMPAVVRQQMIMREDQKTLELMEKRNKEIKEGKSPEKSKEEKVEELENELGIGAEDASKVG